MSLETDERGANDLCHEATTMNSETQLPVSSVRSARTTCLRTLGGVSLVGLAAACSSGGGGPTTTIGPGTTEQPLAFTLDVREDHNLGGAPVQDVVIGEINGDGVLDAAQIDAGGDLVRIGLGQPDGTFLTTLELDTPQDPVALTLADVNGDGMTDVLVAAGRPVAGTSSTGATYAGGTFELAYYEQLAGGGFLATASAQVILPGPPLNLTPFPGVGTTSDVIVTFPQLSNLGRYALTAPGVLEEIDVLDSTAVGLDVPISAAAVDERGDGTVDLVVGEFNRVVLYPNDNAGGFLEPEILVPNVARAFFCCAHDIDGDGFDDVAVAELDADECVLLSNSAAGFSSVQFFALDGAPSAIAFDDYDGDGVLDLAATLYRDSAVEVRLGDGPFSFPQGVLYNCGTTPRNLRAIELPGDTSPDLVLTNAEDFSILENLGDGSFRSMRGYPAADLPYYLVCEDLDGDGDQDAVTVDILQRSIVFMEGLGDGTLLRAGEVHLAETADEIPSYVLVRDFDGDGLPDVLSSVYASGELQLIRNAGTLPFPQPSAVDRYPVGNLPLGIDAALVDDDEYLDVLVANSADNTIQLLRGGPDGTFFPDEPIALPYDPTAVALEDLNGDGFVDAMCSTGDFSFTDTFIITLSGDGTGNFTPEAMFELDAVASMIVCGDIDEDGDCDAVLAQIGQFADEVMICRNAGDYTFEAEPIPVAPDPSSVVVADVDRDGLLDILSATGTGGLFVLIGDGLGGFTNLPGTPETGFPIPQGTAASAFADLDGDELPELLCVAPSLGFVWVSQNRSVPLEVAE